MSAIRCRRLTNGKVILAALLAAAVGLLPLVSCSKQKQGPAAKPAVPVTVDHVSEKTMPVQINAIGNVEAYSTVGVKSQIGGQLLKVHFREGQEVKKGALIFTIDPRPYEAQVKQAEAALAKDKAQMENAQKDERRYGELVNRGYVAKEQYEQFRTNAAALEATVEADKAVLDNARLQLKYCYIYAPITGRTGNLLADEGNLIKANADTPMVTINQLQPIYVSFSVPEQNLSKIKRHMAEGKVGMEVYAEKDDRSPEQGVLTFVDNTVDPATGTIKLKGTFANAQNRLWPGQFVNVRLTLSVQSNALIVPTSAVQTGQDGQYVFVVKPDNTVEMRPVVVDRGVGDETILSRGVARGETVVTDGQLRLGPGARIEIKRPVQMESDKEPPARTSKKAG